MALSWSRLSGLPTGGETAGCCCATSRRAGDPLREGSESIANPEDSRTPSRRLGYRAEDRGEPRDGTRAKVIAIGEPARDNYQAVPGQISVAVPANIRIKTRNDLEGVEGIHVAITAGEYDYAGF